MRNLKTEFHTIDEMLAKEIEPPIPLEVLPNHMGINLCAVDGMSWTRQKDGQLVSVTIHFIPDNDRDYAVMDSHVRMADDARAEKVSFTGEMMHVVLTDGRVVIVPVWWFPRLLRATREQRNKWQLIASGDGIYWDDVDEHLSVRGLLSPVPRRAPGAVAPTASSDTGRWNAYKHHVDVVQEDGGTFVKVSIDDRDASAQGDDPSAPPAPPRRKSFLERLASAAIDWLDDVAEERDAKRSRGAT